MPRIWLLLLLLLPSLALAREEGRDWLQEGVARQKAGDLDGAIAAYEKAIAEKQVVPVAMFNLGTAYALKHQPDEAIAWLKRAAGAGFRSLKSLREDPDLAELRRHPRWGEVVAAVEQAAHPCQDQPIHRQLDFWVGEWDVLNPQGKHVGQSSVKIILGGCVILESWTSDLLGHGQSFNFYDAARKRWRQTWVDDSGGNIDFAGELHDGAMRFEGERPEPRTGLPHRLTFSRLPGGRVRQLAEVTRDGGKTWSVRYDFTYVPKR